MGGRGYVGVEVHTYDTDVTSHTRSPWNTREHMYVRLSLLMVWRPVAVATMMAMAI